MTAAAVAFSCSKSQKFNIKRAVFCVFLLLHIHLLLLLLLLLCFSECQAGNWKCSTNGCESTCSVWGDSHFTTFDSHDFDFQGECDYILSKGVANNGDGYTITIQNVLCGTMGVTCSKSVEIALTGSVQDTLTLAGDATYIEDPNKSVMSSKCFKYHHVNLYSMRFT